MQKFLMREVPVNYNNICSHSRIFSNIDVCCSSPPPPQARDLTRQYRIVLPYGYDTRRWYRIVWNRHFHTIRDDNSENIVSSRIVASLRISAKTNHIFQEPTNNVATAALTSFKNLKSVHFFHQSFLPPEHMLCNQICLQLRFCSWHLTMTPIDLVMFELL